MYYETKSHLQEFNKCTKPEVKKNVSRFINIWIKNYIQFEYLPSWHGLNINVMVCGYEIPTKKRHKERIDYFISNCFSLLCHTMQHSMLPMAESGKRSILGTRF